VHSQSQRAFALVGPGRAGTTLAAALVARGFRCVAVAGRAPEAPSTAAAAQRFAAPAVTVADVGHGAGTPPALVLVATPDSEIAATATALAPSLAPDTLVVHLSGVCTLDELDKVRSARPDVRVGSLHPLQSLPSPEVGLARLPGSWCAVDGPAEVERLALTLGLRPFRVADDRRVAYHAAATVASNHLVALLGQAARVAADAGVPPEALLPLVRGTLDNVDALGACDALTGPVARGDADTVARHLDALADDERATYRALAREALRLSGRDDAGLRALLDAGTEDHAGTEDRAGTDGAHRGRASR
jgi:predicted short-subunit dehydrogenase-like oxidoreductase (DUF2520 family)